MRRVGRAEHRNAFVCLVDRVLLAHFHGGEDVVRIGIDERDIGADLDALGRRLVSRKRYRDRPEETACGAISVAHAAPVCVRHEARERREAADAEHDDVAFFARADAELRQRLRAGALGGEGIAFEQQRIERAGPVGANQTGHE
jgi:hypothetical protein